MVSKPLKTPKDKKAESPEPSVSSDVPIPEHGKPTELEQYKPKAREASSKEKPQPEESTKDLDTTEKLSPVAKTQKKPQKPSITKKDTELSAHIASSGETSEVVDAVLTEQGESQLAVGRDDTSDTREQSVQLEVQAKLIKMKKEATSISDDTAVTNKVEMPSIDGVIDESKVDDDQSETTPITDEVPVSTSTTAVTKAKRKFKQKDKAGKRLSAKADSQVSKDDSHVSEAETESSVGISEPDWSQTETSEGESLDLEDYAKMKEESDEGTQRSYLFSISLHHETQPYVSYDEIANIEFFCFLLMTITSFIRFILV